MKEQRTFEIPQGTPPRKCNGATCGATIYFVPTGKTDEHGRAKKMPVNEDGAPHWATCPNMESFKKPKQGDLFSGGAHGNK